MFAKSKTTSCSAPRTWAIHACGAGLVLATVVAFYQGLYAPWRRDVEDRGQRINQLHKLLATGDAVRDEHRNLSDRLAELHEAVAHTQRRMPSAIEPSDFIEQLTAAAASLGIKIQQCGAGAPEIRPDHAQVDVTCRLTGSYASICRCLAAVDQFPQISKVSRLQIDSAPDSLAYPAQITFQLYYRVDSHDKEVKRGS